LPTASTACFEFDTQVWQDISPENARFQWLKQAKEIEMRDSGDIRE
jgi:phosphohistidine phosphatase